MRTNDTNRMTKRTTKRTTKSTREDEELFQKWFWTFTAFECSLAGITLYVRFQIWHFCKLFSALSAFERFLSSMRRLKIVTKIWKEIVIWMILIRTKIKILLEIWWNFSHKIHIQLIISIKKSRPFKHFIWYWSSIELISLTRLSHPSENFEKVKYINSFVEEKYYIYCKISENLIFKRNRINWNGIE